VLSRNGIFGSNGRSPRWKPGACDRGGLPSSYLIKLKKCPKNKYRTPYKYYAIHWRNIYKMCKDTYVPSKLNYFATILH
jgi:hypothetical protein